MGAKLSSYYEAAKAKGGLAAQIKLAVLTKMAASAAATADDSAQNIKVFEDAMRQL